MFPEGSHHQQASATATETATATATSTFCTPNGGVSIVAQCIGMHESLVLQCSESAIMKSIVLGLHQSLTALGVPSYHLPTSVAVCRALVATALTLLGYYLLFGLNHVRRRQRLAQELQLAQQQLRYLQEKVLRLDDDSVGSDKEVRIFMDGAFDLMHYGHMNAFRLGRSLGTHLVVGVNSDESITQCKGPPLMRDHERLSMVESCKFVDEVVPNCPYIMSKEYLDYVIEKYNIDYVIHGDDPCIVDGKDVYAVAKEAGKFRSIPRTEGVSTTDIVGRMLLLTKEHHYQGTDDASYLLGRQSKFLTTSHMLRLFSAGIKAPCKGMKVVYMDGAWDMFHCGHAAVLKAAKERGDYLIVGIHGDALVNKMRGHNLPLMNLHERVLSVLGCRFVDDVLIDAPYEVSAEMVASLKITEVVHGTRSDDIGVSRINEGERYRYPKKAGIFTVMKSPSDFNLGHIVQRISINQETFQAKFDRKMKVEQDFYAGKYGRDNKSQ
jgi:ethanolamine-phosphate cytidylyltransferase